MNFNKLNILVWIFSLTVLILALKFRYSPKIEFVGSVLGITTFIFGTFLGFTISDRHRRMNSLIKTGTIEKSSLIQIFYLSSIFGKKFQKKILSSIENYLINSLDYNIWDIHKTEKKWKKIMQEILSLKIGKNKKNSTIYSKLIDAVNRTLISRSEATDLINDRISKSEWGVFGIFSLIIMGALILLNSGGIIPNILVILLSFAILLLMIFLYEMDSLRWKEEERVFEPYARTFESIGLIRYYPEEIIKKIKKPKSQYYRVGQFPHPYPNFKNKTIKLVKNY